MNSVLHRRTLLAAMTRLEFSLTAHDAVARLFSGMVGCGYSVLMRFVWVYGRVTSKKGTVL